jgi:hypothetical protein
MADIIDEAENIVASKGSNLGPIDDYLHRDSSCEISGSHGGEYEDGCLLGCSTV